jgi:hypothetical protein
MTLPISLERVPSIELNGLDRNVALYLIQAYASILYVGIVLVGCRLHL